MAYTVYKHTTPNGKVYIGITCRPLEVRWKKDGSGYKTQAFYRAIKKYGWKNIKHDIINAVCGYVERAGGYHWKYYEEGNKHDHSSANYP